MRKKSQVMKEMRRLCESGIRYTNALKRIPSGKISAQCLSQWRRRPMIDRYFLALIVKRDDTVGDAIENKLESRCLNGEATPTEYIFYLVNRRPAKWKRHDSINVKQESHVHYHLGDRLKKSREKANAGKNRVKSSV